MFRFCVKSSSRLIQPGSLISSPLCFQKHFSTSAKELFTPTDLFASRHLGSKDEDIQRMLQTIGFTSLEEMSNHIVPSSIRHSKPLDLKSKDTRSETELLSELREIVSQNEVKRSFIGLGFHNSHTPKIILRNILENPAWYTAYTPYQAEISQGRLEMLLNFQTMVGDLTGLKFANASLLDEGTAASEALLLSSHAYQKPKTLSADKAAKAEQTYFVSRLCHPNTIEVVKTRSEALGHQVIVGDHETFDFEANPVCGALIQYPTTEGTVLDYAQLVERVHKTGGLVACATDLLSLTLLKPPGEFGCDIAIGNSQRFGVPLGFGGPHAAFMAVQNSNLQRKMPGRIIGVSKDSRGKAALRLTLQTREQHIRRDKATSNICTAQALLAIVATSYALFHGPSGLKQIAERTHKISVLLSHLLEKIGFKNVNPVYFDTIHVPVPNADRLMKEAEKNGLNLRKLTEKSVSISLDETVTFQDIRSIVKTFSDINGNNTAVRELNLNDLTNSVESIICQTHNEGKKFVRSSEFLTHEIFHRYHTEHEFLRYINRLVAKDYSLIHGMIPLGSCTMKLNATSEMIPITWPEISNIHPFSPESQLKGYHQLISSLEQDLCRITGFAAVSLQPNAGSQGEYSGLLVIKQYFRSIGQESRNICLIPSSAHGTNPASAVMVGFKVVVINCLDNGYINVDHLKTLIAQYSSQIAAIMVTYPSTFGVYEENIREICDLVHQAGAQVYMDGANMNAQVGLTSPGEIGADVCHLNLHKTFCIPHGGGGPGVGPVCVAKHLVPFLPSKPTSSNVSLPNYHSNSSINTSEFDHTPNKGIPTGPVCSTPYGSASILPISWMYINLMGEAKLKKATQVAILNANYMKTRLDPYYLIKFTSNTKRVAHEFVIDLRPLKKTANVEAEDVAKRLIDYGFHAPTMSWPVPGTLMVEPTESESKEELDRFVDAMISIREEIREIEEGKLKIEESALAGAPHTVDVVSSSEWNRKYSREQAAYPSDWSKRAKFWPSVGRVDNTYGDRHVVCSCPPLSDYQS